MTYSWQPIADFQSIGEFDRFVLWMQKQVEAGMANETAVVAPYIGATTFSEKWFLPVGTSTVWRLVWPDFPFTGLFERIE